MKRKQKIINVAIILLLIIIQIASAENDPGHDTLYIEQQGDSGLNGSLNITSNLTLTSTSKLKQGGVLTLYADGSTPGTGSYISATGEPNYNLYIDTQGSVYFKSSTTGMMYVGVTGTPTSLNVSGALYLNGSNNKLDTGPAGSASGLDLYWGDKLVCDASEANCGWVTSLTGGGDISSVQSENTYIYNGSDTGNVYLRFNESKLNATIEARAALVGGDGNNYTTAIGFSTSGSTVTLNLNRSGSTSNLTTTFNQINNCSADQSCPTILYDTNATNFINTSTGLTYINLTTGATLLRTSTSFTNTSSSDINVSGAYNTLNLQIGNSGVTAASYGGTNQIPVITINAEGRITSASNTSIATWGNLSAQGATAGYIPQFQNGTILNNSIISQSGNTLTIAGNISMPSSFYIGNLAVSNGTITTAIGYASTASGDYATALGREASATGNVATAIGSWASASGEYTVALGREASAAGGQSTALGGSSNASSTGAVAVGSDSKAIEQLATAIGDVTRATEYGATAIGHAANATGAYAVAVGYETDAIASAATAIGGSAQATTQYATAIGYQAQATADYATAIGYGVVNSITNSTKLGGKVILSGELNATSHNVTSVNCIVFDTGGKICSGA